MIERCNICKGGELLEFFSQERVPTSQTPVLPNPNSIEIEGKLRIVECGGCSHIFNAGFKQGLDRELYTESFAASLPTSRGYLSRYREILDWLLEREGSSVRYVLEIGGADFTFTRLLIERGIEKVYVFEPSNVFSSHTENIVHIRDYFSPHALPSTAEPIDLVVLRHVLEHVLEPRVLLSDIAKILPIGSQVYIEVPNVENILDEMRIYDFFYEHVSYFSPRLLSILLEQEGFEVLREATWVGGQHFGILARRRNEKQEVGFTTSPTLLFERCSKLKRFQNHVSQFSEEYRSFFQANPGTAIYGAGAHAITVINMLGLGPNEVPCLFDLNPHKSGRLSPLSHIPIYQPSKDRVKHSKNIMVIAPLHQDEIYQQLRNIHEFKGPIFGTDPSLHELS